MASIKTNGVSTTIITANFNFFSSNSSLVATRCFFHQIALSVPVAKSIHFALRVKTGNRSGTSRSCIEKSYLRRLKRCVLSLMQRHANGSRSSSVGIMQSRGSLNWRASRSACGNRPSTGASVVVALRCEARHAWLKKLTPLRGVSL